MAETERTTSQLAIVVGVLLAVTGAFAYALSDFASITALIPSIFGVLFVALGVVGTQTERSTLAVYAIGVLAALGVFGSLRGLPDVLALLTGGDVDSTIAATTQGAMILFCLLLLGALTRHVLTTR